MTQQCRQKIHGGRAGHRGEGRHCQTAAKVRGIGAASTIGILLVDDDADCRMLIRDAINASKVCNRVHEAGSGREALAYLARCLDRGEALPGLIYLDIEMAGQDGLETLERIRGEAAFAAIPVVMITGICHPDQMRRAAELGANSYTVKPTHPEQFLRTVLESTEYWLSIHQRPGSPSPRSGRGDESDNACGGKTVGCRRRG
jgi:CheY-like chemotaxis protein